jgi:hypothetical protein
MQRGEPDPLWTNTVLLDRILTELETIKATLLRTWVYPRGTTFTSVIHLKKDAQVTRIDFLSVTGHRNIPMGDFDTGGQDIINILGVPVSRLIIYNVGPGGMYFDTNRQFNDNTANTPVFVNSAYEIPSDIPSITSINLAAGDSDAKIRLTAIV